MNAKREQQQQLTYTCTRATAAVAVAAVADFRAHQIPSLSYPFEKKPELLVRLRH